MPPRRILAACLLVAPIAAADARGSVSERRTVSIPSEDGFALQATLFLPRGKGPGVLLLPECAGDRSAFQTLAAKLASVGIRVLALDFRGLGGSRAGEYDDFAARKERILPKMPADVDAAYRFLAAQPTVDSPSVGVFGAACGATEALLFAARHPDRVRSLALLSPEPDERTARVAATLPGVPLLLFAGEGDAAAAELARALFARSVHPESRLVLYKGEAHGAALYGRDRSLKGGLADWFESTVAPAPPGAPMPPPAPPR